MCCNKQKLRTIIKNNNVGFFVYQCVLITFRSHLHCRIFPFNVDGANTAEAPKHSSLDFSKLLFMVKFNND